MKAIKEIDFVAGPTIEEAIARSRKQASIEKGPVAANINDIIMIIDTNTDQEKALSEYYQKHALRCEIEKVRSEERRKEQR